MAEWLRHRSAKPIFMSSTLILVSNMVSLVYAVKHFTVNEENRVRAPKSTQQAYSLTDKTLSYGLRAVGSIPTTLTLVLLPQKSTVS